MSVDISTAKLKEKVVLKKYDGPAPKVGENKDPVEIIIIDNGIKTVVHSQGDVSCQ